ncbi:MAG: hypothetical protein P8M80_16255 [Pirellulaceae bacterium]|nr:hypothetical protein [Pirellulaceae bacterium]
MNESNLSRQMKMTGRLQKFVQKTKSIKEEAAALEKEIRQKALQLVPRCELNANLPDDATGEQLWKGIHSNFEWSFGPAKGKTLRKTKTPFLKWAFRKLKDPVRTICHIELMLREKKIIDPHPADDQEGSDESASDPPVS